MAPSLVADTAFGRWGAQHRKGWTSTAYVAILVIAAFMLASPDFDIFPQPGSTQAWLASLGLYLLTLIAGSRHVWLSRVAGRSAPLVIAFGFMLVGSSSFAFIDPTVWSAYFWLAHAFDIVGVFLATIGGVLVYRNSCLLYTSPSPRDKRQSRMPSSA